MPHWVSFVDLTIAVAAHRLLSSLSEHQRPYLMYESVGEVVFVDAGWASEQVANGQHT